MAHFALTTDNVDAEGTVALFLKHVFALHGLPDDVVSDQGVTFTAKFTQEVLKALKVQQKLSIAYHPQTDGQTECTNAILEQYLKCYIDYQQSDWSTLLPLAEFAYINTSQSSTQVTPFFANMGYQLLFSVTVPRTSKTNQSTTDWIQELKDLHADLKFNIQMALE
jgi:transposase InsO family protein